MNVNVFWTSCPKFLKYEMMKTFIFKVIYYIPYEQLYTLHYIPLKEEPLNFNFEFLESRETFLSHIQNKRKLSVLECVKIYYYIKMYLFPYL